MISLRRDPTGDTSTKNNKAHAGKHHVPAPVKTFLPMIMTPSITADDSRRKGRENQGTATGRGPALRFHKTY